MEATAASNEKSDDVARPLDEDTILVRKRDGRIVDFDEYNIYHAVVMALRETNTEVTDDIAADINDIATQVKKSITERYTQPVHIEDIQTLVEQGIIGKGWYDTAKHYSSYRTSRDIKRAKAKDVNHAVESLIRKDESIVNENANKTPTFIPRRGIYFPAPSPRPRRSSCCPPTSPTPT
jgi:ribonucleoside-triphosphate reductase